MKEEMTLEDIARVKTYINVYDQDDEDELTMTDYCRVIAKDGKCKNCTYLKALRLHLTYGVTELNDSGNGPCEDPGPAELRDNCVEILDKIKNCV